jgi:hypothetical protein
MRHIRLRHEPVGLTQMFACFAPDPRVQRRVFTVAATAARKAKRAAATSGRMSAASVAATEFGKFEVEHVLGSQVAASEVGGMGARSAGRLAGRPPLGAVLVVSEQLDSKQVKRAMTAAAGVSSVIEDRVISVALSNAAGEGGTALCDGEGHVVRGVARCTHAAQPPAQRLQQYMGPTTWHPLCHPAMAFCACNSTTLAYDCRTQGILAHNRPPLHTLNPASQLPPRARRRRSWPARSPTRSASTGPAAGSQASQRSPGLGSAAAPT